MIKSIMFDLDGTLWDTTKNVTKIWQEVGKEYNIQIEKDFIEGIMGLTKNEIIKRLFNGNTILGKEYISKCQEKENKYLAQNGGELYKNTQETITKLAKEHDLYIVSNCQKDYLKAFLDYYNFNKYFKDVECAGNTNLDKPDNIKIVMERNNIKDAIYVGDTIKDEKSARTCGIKFVWAKYGFGKCEDYDYSIEDIKDLISIVQK